MKIIKGILALIASAVLLVGVPLALYTYTGTPLAKVAALPTLFERPDFGGTIVFGSLVPVMAWILWAWLAIGFLAGAVGAIRQVRAPKLKGFGLGQNIGGTLVGAIVAMIVGLGSALPANAAAPAPTQITPATTISAEQAPAATQGKTHITSTQSITVKPGETLWGLAEKYLGDGAKFKQIAELNYGKPQHGGGALRHDHVLQPGWVLSLPAHAEVRVPTVYEVRAGDTLLEIADRVLGDRALVSDIVALNPSITDPDMISVGQKLRMPKTGPTADTAARARDAQVLAAASRTSTDAQQPREGAAPAPEAHKSAPTPEMPAVETAEPSASAERELSPTASAMASHVPGEAADVDVSEGGTVSPVVTVGGIGGLLAAGLLSLLGVRRVRQRRERKAGQRTPAVSVESAQIERRLVEVQEPGSVEDIDAALSYLGWWAQAHQRALPELFCVSVPRASGELMLFLESGAQLPVPFEQVAEDATAWRIHRDQLPEIPQVPSPPYPALVTIGHDANDGLLALNLENLGALNIRGESSVSGEVMNAIAVELGVAPWAEGLRVTLVGIDSPLPVGLNNGRIEKCDDVSQLLLRLHGVERDCAAALAELGVGSISEGRGVDHDALDWAPEIVLVGAGMDPAELAELQSLVLQVPRLCVAAVIEGGEQGQWTLTVDGEMGLLDPVGLKVRPQRLSAAESAALAEALQVSLMGPEADESSQVPAELTRATRLTLLEAEAETEAEADSETETETETEMDVLGAAVTVDPSEEGATAVRPADEEDVTEEEAPESATVDAEEVEAGEVEATTERADGEAGAESLPFIRVLGPLEVVGARGEAPLSRHTGQVSPVTLERIQALLAFMALHPGAGFREVHLAFWPNQDPAGKSPGASRNKLTNQARKYLGADDEGVVLLPMVASGYRLDSRVRSDWDVFQELVGGRPEHASTERLTAALRLVRGAPFQDGSEKNTAWAATDRHEITAVVCSAAHVLMQRALQQHDTELADLAARAGRLIDPVNEQMFRDQMLAEDLAGRSSGVAKVYQELCEQLAQIDEEYEPEPETDRLYQELRDGHRIAS